MTKKAKTSKIVHYTHLNQAEFDRIKGALADWTPKEVMKLTGRSTNTISYISQCQTYDEYQAVVRARYNKRLEDQRSLFGAVHAAETAVPTTSEDPTTPAPIPDETPTPDENEPTVARNQDFVAMRELTKEVRNLANEMRLARVQAATRKSVFSRG